VEGRGPDVAAEGPALEGAAAAAEDWGVFDPS